MSAFLYTENNYSIFQLNGDRVIAELDGYLAMPVNSLTPGTWQKNFLLNSTGKIEAEITLMRMEENDCMAVMPDACADRFFDFFDRNLSPDTTMADISDVLNTVEIWGESAQEILSTLAGNNTALPTDGEWRKIPFGEINAIIAAGENNYFTIVSATAAVETMLGKFDAFDNIAEAEFEDYELFRISAGIPAFPTEINPGRTPVECGITSLISMAEKREFRGAKAMLEKRPQTALALICCENSRKFKPGCVVKFNARKSGIITSSAYDRKNHRSVAFAEIEAKNNISTDDSISVESEKGIIQGKVVKLQFFS